MSPSERWRDGPPPFDEPWQAETLAIADLLVRSGRWTASRWAEALGAEIKALAAGGVPDDAETYFRAALGAVERLLAADGLVSAAELEQRTHAWARAYRDTPHGQPVRPL